MCVLNNKTVSDERDARIRIVLPFKVQKSANALRHQLGDRSRKIDVKIKGQFKTKAQKPPLVNQQNVIYCAVCRLHDGVDTYINVWRNTIKRLTIGNQVKDEREKDPQTIIESNFEILR